ncbi:cytochrome P450 2L1-like isoform X2 [Macrobrachium nipponense]|uniref:cytochrome P450 2L1-like isoform X2 n=1 Tax=Macrobrachium nipponense TaxID=159736 RepID=UPI0030C81398
MLTWTLLVLFLGLLYWLSRKPSSLPPGRWGLPIIGYIPLYTSDVRKIISDLREKYGDIFTWKVGSHVMVFFCDYELIKTTFNRPECQGRPSLFSFSLIRFHENAGILYAVGDVWVQGRRFALKHLKDFGMGKSSLEGAIQYEAQNLVGTFERTSGKPIEISWCLNVAVLNVIWKLVANFDLVITLDDFFGAGSETTSSTIRWLIALLATHPEIQTKMQKEIDEVVPRDTLPSLQDKDRLPYTEAVILEVMRYASFIPIGIMHATTEEIQVGKYRLPKNTAIFASARSCHRNQKYFERPEEFYPEHFLDKEGKVIMKKEGFLPFSLGRRQCLGESLARMELFIFATSLFQRFTASPPKGGSISLEPDCFQPLLSFIPPYEVVLTKRT